MSTNNQTLESLKYERGALQVLDQLLVPHQVVWVPVKNVADGVTVIKTMQVRGAPLIGVVGCLSIAVELAKEPKTGDALRRFVETAVHDLIAARPTAVNMKTEGEKILKYMSQSLEAKDSECKLAGLIQHIEGLVSIDIGSNKAIGNHGADVIMAPSLEPLNVLTHCNTGSLATCGYGTALGVIRSLRERGRLNHAYFTETRPYNQGSRLTSFELLYDKIPSTMVCDSTVAWLMKNKVISAVVTGADRVARNGDTANKIGTYQLALIAKAHNVPFYIAAPFTTIDPNILSGDSIVIEQRPADEVTMIAGKRISPEGISVWNPAFDVTPASLITAIFTDKGSFKPEELTRQFP